MCSTSLLTPLTHSLLAKPPFYTSRTKTSEKKTSLSKRLNTTFVLGSNDIYSYLSQKVRRLT